MTNSPEKEYGKRLLHTANSPAQADVYITQKGQKQFLHKDFTSRPLFIRMLITRRCLKHEYRILSRLKGLSGVPSVSDKFCKDVLTMNYLDNTEPLPNQKEVSSEIYPDMDFFNKLKTLYKQIHERGIAHADVRRRNILRGSRGNPYVIDFGASIICPDNASVLRKKLFKTFCRIDDLTVLKIQKSYDPNMLSEEEKEKLTDLPWFLSFGRYLRRNIYRRYLKPKKWKKRLRKHHIN